MKPVSLSLLLVFYFWLLPYYSSGQAVAMQNAVTDCSQGFPSNASQLRMDLLKRQLVLQRYKTLPVYILADSFNSSLYLYNPETKKGELDVLVYNEAGELMEQKKQGLTEKVVQLDLHQLLRGNYYVQIVAPDFVLTKKVKKRL